MKLMVQCPQVNHHLLLPLRGLMTCDENMNVILIAMPPSHCYCFAYYHDQ